MQIKMTKGEVVEETDIDGTVYKYSFMEAMYFRCARCGSSQDAPHWIDLERKNEDECRTCSPARRKYENEEILKLYEDREAEKERLNPTFRNLGSSTGW